MQSARRKTFWILLTISLGLSAPLGIWLAANPGPFLRRIGFNEHALSIPIAWLLTTVIAGGYIAYTFRAVPFVNENKYEFSALKMIGIWSALTTGMMEEIVFRMLLMDWAQSNGFGTVLQIVLSAIAFGLAHALWVLLRGELKIALPVIISTSTLGALLAMLFVTGQRNVLPCIVAHTVINLAIEPWLLLAAVSGKMSRQRIDVATSAG